MFHIVADNNHCLIALCDVVLIRVMELTAPLSAFVVFFCPWSCGFGGFYVLALEFWMIFVGGGGVGFSSGVAIGVRHKL